MWSVRGCLPAPCCAVLLTKGAAGWYAAPYTGFGRAYQKAFTRVFPDQGDAGHYGGGSPRKSLGQWLWTYGWPHRVISAAGGWYTSKVAMHLYFTPHRFTILQALQQSGGEAGGG
ncbi:hypothetical protein CYMTET_38870 [Cymbomonas tetramitiformis]|uniref:Uncharacterized protein n=1 Tax=Cymbomonas tetramitiformis TaxID=36881 RepID=A0AAE0CDE6_9CHLO|nr:hypothetical protein CYMTET_38870 [Cymbomonas tetramitiformis]